MRRSRRSKPTASDDEPWMGPLPASPGCDCQICRPEESYDELDRRAIDSVLAHGWQVMLVSSDVACSDPDHGSGGHHHDDGDSAPPFAYTVGLGHRCGHPELLMSGLPPGLMHNSLNHVAARVLAGRRLAPGDVLEDVLGGVPVVMERVSADGLEQTVRWSGWFHRREPEALMIVWPTTSGIFAWQPGAPDDLDALQPPEWRERLEHAGALAADPPWPFPIPADRLAFSCIHVLDDRDAVRYAARQSDADRGEDWTIHCGAPEHPTDQIRVAHIAHLVRAAPSLRDLAGLGLDQEASRGDVDEPWQVTSIPELPG